MSYGKLGSSSQILQRYLRCDTCTSSRPWTVLAVVSLIVGAVILAAAAASAVVLLQLVRTNTGGSRSREPTQAIALTCERTLYPNLCVKSLQDFPGSDVASVPDLVHITVNLTLGRFGKALYVASGIGNLPMEPDVRSAYDDCIELLQDSIDLLGQSLASISTADRQDVMTWLSAALSNQATCVEGFDEGVGGGGGGGRNVKDHIGLRLEDLSELVSNCLAIFAAVGGDDFAGIPIQHRRLMTERSDSISIFPEWLSQHGRQLLDAPVTVIHADIVVSKDGNGTCQTIYEAIKRSPDRSARRTIIYIKAGRYEEKNLKVGRKKTNLMFIGDGKGVTVISGGKSVYDNMTTFHTASFAVTGEGFIARDITFENWAGPEKHQAVALRVGADHAVVYRCSIMGYQDTLYVHSQRQFFRECDIYGTVDFIFGNAAVVFQNCSIYARQPMANQKNTVTAQNRKDPNQNTGISIHDCQILATPELETTMANFSTYLGRPWKLYSRTVYMLSYIGDHVHPRGWLEWNDTFALDTLYYGEYMNFGPMSNTTRRVDWPGFRVINSSDEATRFTVSKFIYGSSWLPTTGVAFLAGLSV